MYMFMHRAKLSHPTGHIILDVRPVTQIFNVSYLGLITQQYCHATPQITRRALNPPPISLLFFSSLSVSG